MMHARMLRSIAVGLVVCLTPACGGDDGNDRPGPDAGPGSGPDGGGTSDGGPAPTLTVLVSKDGSDLHDGIDKPVETLRRAIELATADPRITDIAIAPGNYTMRGGETFPYKVPINVVIAGPTVGAAVFIGTGAETGLMFTSGQLQNVELRNFKVAIEASGMLRLKNLKIAESATALHGDRNAKLRIDNLDIAGPALGGCSTGIALEGELFATTVTTRNVAPALAAAAAGPIDIAMGNFVAMSLCARPTLEVVAATKSFALSDSTIDGGPVGLNLVAMSSTPPVEATITNTIVRNLSTGIKARLLTVTMTGGSISNSTFNAFEGDEGLFRITSTFINSNRGSGVVIRGIMGIPATLVMRGAGVFGNGGSAVQFGEYANADLGTAASPGMNDFDLNTGAAIDANGQAGQGQIDAVGNMWRRNIQGSDANGLYTTRTTVQGPVAGQQGNNYALGAGWSLSL
jgi:hypothetical protein